MNGLSQLEHALRSPDPSREQVAVVFSWLIVLLTVLWFLGWFLDTDFEAHCVASNGVYGHHHLVVPTCHIRPIDWLQYLDDAS